MTTATVPGEPFVHPALIYHGDHEYVEATTRFVSDGVAAAEPVAVAVPPRGWSSSEALWDRGPPTSTGST